jgi:SAM-dependent methyltransferase
LVAAPAGGLDLLDDQAREAADRFGAQYTALRRKEGWIGPDGREDPEGGAPRLWRARLDAMSQVASALTGLGSVGKPVVLDIGSGGGWAARYLGDTAVIAIDLLDSGGGSAAIQVRADMSSLPVRDHTVDAALYIASLHYAALGDSIRQAARVLRPGGVLVALDSPIYRDRTAQAQAAARSAAYYAHAGFPELADHYHPIDLGALRAALEANGFRVVRLDAGTSSARWWRRMGRPRHPSFLLAKSIPG